MDSDNKNAEVESDKVINPPNETSQSAPTNNTDLIDTNILQANTPFTASHSRIDHIKPAILAIVCITSLAFWYFACYKPSLYHSTTTIIPDESLTTGIDSDTDDTDTIIDTDTITKDDIDTTIPTTSVNTNSIDQILNPTTGEVWLQEPIKLASQGFYSDEVEKDPSNDGESTALYYEVGTRSGNTIIAAFIPNWISSGYNADLFEKTPDGTIKYICNPNLSNTYRPEFCTVEYNSNFKSNIKYDENTHYDSLSYPSQIEIKDNGVVFDIKNYLGSMYLSDLPSGTTETTVKIIGQSSIIKRENTNVETGLTSISYFIKSPINSQVAVEYNPISKNLKDYSWRNGSTKISDSINPISYGCGGVFSNVSVTRINSINDSDVQIAGTTNNNEPVYEFADLNNSTLKKAYDEFKVLVQRYENSQYYDITLEDFAHKEHAVILFKDIYGQWLVFVRSTLAPELGCAKPVIYLYPEIEQRINVFVGADVKVSDPFYNPKTGWSAIAKPSGQLSVNGEQYDSLFWEGLGFGEYPNITSGTIVKKQDAVTTIRSQLAEQGLNNKESQDFIDYWQSKIPNKPYIRLTWFDTEQMNQLAPLRISPKPDTVIRVFLDMSGLDTPIRIPSQTLKSTPRSGFTVVEWGGLSNGLFK